MASQRLLSALNYNRYNRNNNSNKSKITKGYHRKSICSVNLGCIGSNRNHGQRIWLLLMLFTLMWHLNAVEGVQGYKSLQQQYQRRQQQQMQEYAKLMESKMSNQMAETTKTVKKQLGNYQRQQHQHQQHQQQQHHEYDINFNKPKSLEIVNENHLENNDREENEQQQFQQQQFQQQLQQEQQQQQQQQQIIDDVIPLNETNEMVKVGQNNNLPSSEVYQSKTNLYQQDAADITDTLKTGFYFFLALSIMAIVVILVKVYRLRLSRAERKYGVQGDRTTQELTPLPMAIDDGPSDDDDHTLFDIQRQQLRIF